MCLSISLSECFVSLSRSVSCLSLFLSLSVVHVDAFLERYYFETFCFFDGRGLKKSATGGGGGGGSVTNLL